MNKKIRTIIEITETHVKFLQSKIIRGKRVILTNEYVPIVNGTNQEIAGLLKKLAKKHPIYKNDFLLVIPRSFIIFKRFNLPSKKPQEIKKMIGLQLIAKIPYSLEEIEYFEYYIKDGDTSQSTNVLLAVIHKEIIDPLLKYLKEAQLPAPKWTVSSMGLLGWWTIYQNISKDIDGEIVILINIDSEHSEICFLSKATLLYSRNIPFGARDLNEETIEPFSKNIELSIAAYKNEEMGPVTKDCIIISEIFEAQMLKEKLSKACSLSIKVVSSMGALNIKNHKTLPSSDSYQGPSLAVTIGLSATNAFQLWNVTPKIINEGKLAKHRHGKIIKFLFLLSVTALLIILLWLVDLFQARILLKKWQDHRKTIQVEVDEAQQKINHVDFFRNEFNQRFFIVDIIAAINQILPESIVLERIQLDSGDKFIIQGSAENAADINRFQSDLLKTEKFKEVSLEFQKKRKMQNKITTIFKISTQVQKGQM